MPAVVDFLIDCDFDYAGGFACTGGGWVTKRNAYTQESSIDEDDMKRRVNMQAL